MNLFYAPASRIDRTHVELPAEESNHAVAVMRLDAGDTLHVTDGAGNFYRATIDQADRRKVIASIQSHRAIPEPWPLVAAIGQVKTRQRLEFAVEKAVELGCTRISLFHSRRAEKKQAKLSRLQSIVTEAMKQSLQVYLPVVEQYRSLEQLLQDHRDHRLIAAHEGDQAADTMPVIHRDSPYCLLTGPEGGFEQQEADRIRAFGGQIVGLGTRRLRTETAALFMLSHVHQESGAGTVRTGTGPGAETGG